MNGRVYFESDTGRRAIPERGGATGIDQALRGRFMLQPANPDQSREMHRFRAGWQARAALLATCLAAFMSSFAVSSVNMILPMLSGYFHASYSATQWVVIAYLLAVSSSLIVAGRLSDDLGRRRSFLIGATLFICASSAAAFAESLLVQTFLRVVQGVGSGILLAVNLAIVRELSRPAALPLNVGLIGGISSLGTASGPIVSGALAEAWGWQAIYLANVPIGLAALALGWKYLPAVPGVAWRVKKFDFSGSFLAVLAVSLFIVTVKSVGRAEGHPLAFAVLALIAIGAFSRSLAATDTPVIDPAILFDERFRTDLAANFLVASVIMTSLVIGPYYLTGGLGLTVSQAGLIMAASPLSVAIISPLAGRAVRLWGAELTGIVGLAIQATGCLGMAWLSLSWGVRGYLACLLVTAVGYGVFAASNNSGVMQRASPENASQISGLLHLSRNLGLLFGATLMSTVFAWAAHTARSDLIPPEFNERGLNACYGVAAVLVASALTARLRRRGGQSVAVCLTPCARDQFQHRDEEI